MNLRSKSRVVLADLLSVVFMGMISLLSTLCSWPLIFFPELGALTFEVLRNPQGKWASSPWFLALTPPLTGLVGVVVTRSLPYGLLSMLLVVLLCVSLVRWLRSPVAPAISAGVLPVVMRLEAWDYPLAILVGTLLLAVGSQFWKMLPLNQLQSGHKQQSPPLQPGSRLVVDSFDSGRPIGSGRWWGVTLLLFTFAAVGLVLATGWKLILFPPLVVIAYEMLVHPTACPWALQPWKLPIVCTLAASLGVAAVMLVGAGVISTVLAITMGILVLRILRLSVPPALAVALIPQIMEQPTVVYPMSVGIGTALLVLFFKGSQRLACRTSISPPTQMDDADMREHISLQ